MIFIEDEEYKRFQDEISFFRREIELAHKQKIEIIDTIESTLQAMKEKIEKWDYEHGYFENSDDLKQFMHDLIDDPSCRDKDVGGYVLSIIAYELRTALEKFRY